MIRTEIDSLLALDRQLLWHPYAPMRSAPPVNLGESASGMHIRLADGTDLLDGISSWWCVCHGHNHPAIMEAVRRQTEKLSQLMFAGFTHEPAIRLAEALRKVTPPGVNRVFFADSGSVSVECALKLALQYQIAAGHPEKNRLATVKGGYHGDTTGAMAVSDPDGMHRMFATLLPQHFFAARPEIPFGGEWNDSDFKPMEELLEEHSGEIAAVILEPVFQGANGMRFYHPEYLRKLRQACDTHRILLILDEIATGFGRTGKFFALQYPDIVPDIMCVGKGLTGGAITLAAVIASENVAEVVSDHGNGRFMHGPTFMANPLACAAGCASLKLFEEGNWKNSVSRIERKLSAGLAPLRGTPNVLDVRVLGAIGVVELEHLPSAEKQFQLVRETGVWLRPFGNWLYSMPPYCASEVDLEQICEAMKQMSRP